MICPTCQTEMIPGRSMIGAGARVFVGTSRLRIGMVMLYSRTLTSCVPIIATNVVLFWLKPPAGGFRRWNREGAQLNRRTFNIVAGISLLLDFCCCIGALVWSGPSGLEIRQVCIWGIMFGQ